MGRLLDARVLATACVIGLLISCFGPIANPQRQLAYRDFSDFYYPLYQKVQQEWSAGRLPLWSSGENCGTPLLGNPTAAVLYPGKLIYAALPYPWAAKAYVVAHVLLAFTTMVILLRGWKVSAVGSTLGGLAYAFGAPVLTQYSNVVFLVGAAWMPLGFRFADSWVRFGNRRSIAGLALVLALQVLGGDPEAAYLTAVASAAYAAGGWIFRDGPGRSRRIGLTVVGLVATYAILFAVEYIYRPSLPGKIEPGGPHSTWRITTSQVSLGLWAVFGLFLVFRRFSKRSRSPFESRLIGLGGACLLGLALCGVQVVPSLEFIGQSSRNDASTPVDIYGHSIHPARVVESFWPNAFGATFGQNRNWLTALPPNNDHNVWMNSIYVGGLTMLLAGSALWFRSGSAGQGWMIGVALVGILGGLGDYASPVFLARAWPGGETRFGKLEGADPPLPRDDGLLRDGDGGVYWFLSSGLPGFRSFRFPGKLFIPAALGICALAGMGFDRLIAGHRRMGQIMAGVVLIVSFVGFSLPFLGSSWVLAGLETRSEWARSAFGPFDKLGALADLRRAMIHGAIVASAFLVLARFAVKSPRLTGILALGILTVDLAVANRGELGTVAQSAYDAEPRTLAAILRSERANPEAGPFRIFRLPSWALYRWSETSSPDRLEETIRWERDTLRSKYEMPLGLESTFAYGTAELAEFRQLFEPFRVNPDPALAQKLGIPSGKPVIYYPRQAFNLWNTRYFIVPSRLAWNSSSRGFTSLLPETKPIYPELFSGPDAKARREEWGRDQDVQVLRNQAVFPRAWVVHRALPVASPARMTPSARQSFFTQLLYEDDELWHIDGWEPTNFRQVAYVEATSDDLAHLGREGPAPEPVRVIEGNDPSRVELEVTLASAGLVILADTNYPGWSLKSMRNRRGSSGRISR